MGDWLGGLWSGISGAAGDVWGSVTGIFGDEGLPSEDAGFGMDDIPGSGSGDFPAQVTQAAVDLIGGDDMNGYGDGGSFQPAVFQQAGMGGGLVAAGGIWLGSLLARALGAAGRGAVFTAANGVRVRMGQLWPLVKRYGSEAVAGGLGVSLGALGTLLATPDALSGRAGRKGRGRGISARDVKTTRRTLKQIRKLYSMMPKRASSWGGGGGGYRSYRPRYRSYRR